MSGRTRTRQLQIMTPEEELENLRNEVGVLRRAVESKSAAVGILRAELQECQRERDKFRTLAEQGPLHRSSASTVSKPAYSDPCRSAMLSGSDGTLAQLLSQSKEENKMLRQDATELRCKLHDAQADIKVLREEVQRSRGDEGRRRSHAHTTMSQLAHQEREQFISQMEELSAKCQALEGDVRGLVEEREELVRELDASAHKLHRLNYILNTVLATTSANNATTPPKRIIDLDAIITENRYLQQRLKQSEEEKALAKSNASKYKAALEKCRSQGSLKLGTSENLIVTPQQVCELLHDYRGEVGGAAESDLKSLCVALVDALNQRSRALRTQRSANKVLVGRVSELERRLSTIGSPEDTNSDKDGMSPRDGAPDIQLASLGLMDGYAPPAGPIAKYNEDDIIQDPRLAKLIHTMSSGQESAERNKTDGYLSNGTVNGKFNDNVSNQNYGHEKKLSRNCEGRLSDVPENKGKCESQSSGVNSIAPVVTNKSAVVQTNNECDKIFLPVIEDIEVKKCEGKTMTGGESEDDKREVPGTDGTAILGDPKSKLTTTNKQVKGSKTGKKELSAVNGVPSKEVNVQNIHDKKISAYVNPEDDLEEIIPIDQLDSYIREVQLKRKQLVNTESNTENKPISDLNDPLRTSGKGTDNSITLEDSSEALTDPEHLNSLEVKGDVEENEDDDSSFDLNISDYDSDNDNLDVALQEWQNDFGKGKMKKGSPTKDSKTKRAKGKEGFNLWRKDTSSETQLPPALKELLDRATDTVDNDMNCT